MDQTRRLTGAELFGFATRVFELGADVGVKEQTGLDPLVAVRR